MTEQLQRYIEQHSDPEGDYLHRLWRATHLHTLHGRMVSGHVEGRLLKMLVTMIRPKHILEIGTFTGYSALCMAEGLRSIGDGGSSTPSMSMTNWSHSRASGSMDQDWATTSTSASATPSSKHPNWA